MASISTNITRSWSLLRNRFNESSSKNPDIFRSWLNEDFPKISKKIPPLLQKLKSKPHFLSLLEEEYSKLPITEKKMNDFLGLLNSTPEYKDPIKMWHWLESKLWELFVFTGPDDSCDIEQYDLEVWKNTNGTLVLNCGIHFFQFIRRKNSGYEHPLKLQTADTADLVPALRADLLNYYDEIEFVK